MPSRPSMLEKLKVFVVVEFLAIAMSLALALMPRRGSGEFIDLPPDAISYLREVLVCFGLVNGIMLAVALAAWLYGSANRSSTADDAADPSSSQDSAPPDPSPPFV